MRKIKPLILIIVAALAARLFFFFDYHLIWWDSAVYIGMGKYIFSLGQQGLWEPLRPIIWPFILGIIWKIKLDPVFFGRILTTILSLAIIFLTYLIAKEFSNKKTAIISSILIGFSSIFFFSNFRLYTEIPTLFFILLAFYLLLKQKNLLSGIFLSLAFLTKFPSGIYIIPFAIFLLFNKTKLKDISQLGIGFIIPIIPYFIFNQLLYGNFLLPLIEAKQSISQVLGCNYLWYQPWHFYLREIIKENFLNIFALTGIYLSIKKPNKKTWLLLLSLALPLLYFTQLHCRDIRYLIIFIPFISIFASKGLLHIFEKIKFKNFNIFLILILIISSTIAIAYYQINEQPKTEPEIWTEYYKYLDDKIIEKELWISSPYHILYTDKKANLVYYPRFYAEIVPALQEYFSQNYNNVSYVFLDTCAGGIICKQEDTLCLEKRNNLIQTLNTTMNLDYYKKINECDYYIFKQR